MITRLYTLFLALLLALFIGVGIGAFYQGPKSPEPPASLTTPYKSAPASPSAEETAAQTDYQKTQDGYNTANNLYSRNLSLIALAGAIVLVALGLTLFKSVAIMGDSLLLGGVFTLIYSIARGFNTQDQRFRFVLVATSLVVAITLGYLKLIKHEIARKK
jgi:hypothetical protein